MVQILFPEPLPARHQQPKLFRRTFLHGFVVHFMCSADACQVTVVASERLESVVDKPIVKNKIDDTVYADTGAYPEAIV